MGAFDLESDWSVGGPGGLTAPAAAGHAALADLNHYHHTSRKGFPWLVSVPTTAEMPTLNPNLTLVALQIRS